MITPVQSEPMHSYQSEPVQAGERDALLAEVDFKWLMAGQGWWVDTARFHGDPDYAAQFLRSASRHLVRHCVNARLACRR